VIITKIKGGQVGTALKVGFNGFSYFILK